MSRAELLGLHRGHPVHGQGLALHVFRDLLKPTADGSADGSFGGESQPLGKRGPAKKKSAQEKPKEHRGKRLKDNSSGKPRGKPKKKKENQKDGLIKPYALYVINKLKAQPRSPGFLFKHGSDKNKNKKLPLLWAIHFSLLGK